MQVEPWHALELQAASQSSHADPLADMAQGSEARDAFLGRIFGCGAVFQAGRAGGSYEAAARLTSSLLHAGAQKAFLREAAASALLAGLEALPQPVLARLLAEHAGLREVLTAQAAEATPEVWILHCFSHHPACSHCSIFPRMHLCSVPCACHRACCFRIDEGHPRHVSDGTQAVLLALRLWARMPDEMAAACPLLPGAGQPAPPPTFFTALPGNSPEPAPAAAAIFTQAHLAALSPALLEASTAHPRVHGVWHSLLALLLPGFTPSKVAFTHCCLQ